VKPVPAVKGKVAVGPAARPRDCRRWWTNLPAGARRLVQRARGIAATVVNGEVLLRDGKHTGALPGQLLRGPLGRRA
jgi:N-acyl-D-aspartate/D-glutamate deacylase